MGREQTDGRRAAVNQSINQSIRGRGDISTPLNKGSRDAGGRFEFFGGCFPLGWFPFFLLSRDSLLSFIRLRFDLSIRPKTTAAIFSRFDRCSVFAGVLHLDS